MDATAKMAKTVPGMDKGMTVAVYPMMDMMMPMPDKKMDMQMVGTAAKK
jgi:hypothetical protein